MDWTMDTVISNHSYKGKWKCAKTTSQLANYPYEQSHVESHTEPDEPTSCRNSQQRARPVLKQIEALTNKCLIWESCVISIHNANIFTIMSSSTLSDWPYFGLQWWSAISTTNLVKVIQVLYAQQHGAVLNYGSIDEWFKPHNVNWKQAFHKVASFHQHYFNIYTADIPLPRAPVQVQMTSPSHLHTQARVQPRNTYNHTYIKLLHGQNKTISHKIQTKQLALCSLQTL